MKKILITGASGYIGSCLSLYLKKKYKLTLVDIKNRSSLNITNCNLLNFKKLTKILKETKPDLIIHLSAQSLVDETINKKKYYQNNVIATKNLLKAMKVNDLNNIIFSSTALCCLSI